MKWIVIALCVLAPVSAACQDNSGARLGSSIGHMLFDRNDDRAYYEGLAQGALVRQQMESAAAANAEADRIEKDNVIRSALAKAWVKAGFAEGEAAAIASAYQYQPVEQAIVARAKRDGSKATIEAIRAAYANYNYLLADQLLIGYFYAAEAEKVAAQNEIPHKPAGQ